MPSMSDTRAIGVYEVMRQCLRHGADAVTMFPQDRFSISRDGRSRVARIRTSSYADWQETEAPDRDDYDAMIMINVRDPEKIAILDRETYQQRAAIPTARPRTPGSPHRAPKLADVADKIGNWAAVGLRP